MLSKIVVATTLVCICRPANADAVACKPRWYGTRTVEASCDFPASAKIHGDIIVGPYTVTVPSGVVMGIDLVANKMTFTTGMVMYVGTSKSDNSVSNRYQLNISYSEGVNASCPAGMQVLNAAGTGFAGSFESAPRNGTLSCAYP